jgi:hypothetical protein
VLLAGSGRAVYHECDSNSTLAAAPSENDNCALPRARPHANVSVGKDIVLGSQSSFTALLALLLWAPISLLLFREMKAHRAAGLLLVGGAILLPERFFFTLPLLSKVDKKMIVCAWAMLAAVMWYGRRLQRTRLGGFPRLLLLLLLIVDVGRALTNGDAIAYAAGILPHTAVTFVMEDFLNLYVPFILGAAFFSERSTLEDLLKIFTAAGMLYVPLVVLELRFSPQLHSWVYGYMQHEWSQVMREGGYRPMVFMEHGLAVALFLATCALAAVGLAKCRIKTLGWSTRTFATILCLLVLINPSFGARLFLVTLVPLIAWGSLKLQVRVAAALGLLVIAYPVLRASQLFPAHDIVTWLGQYAPDRAGSLDFRMTNEDLVLQRTLQRPWFGWGGFERKFIVDRDSGKFNILDGAWIITTADSGILGFIARYGLLTWPLWQALRQFKRISDPIDRRLIATTALILAMVTVDLLPNGMFTYFPALFSGTLLGALRTLASQRRAEAGATAARPARASIPVPVDPVNR